MGIMTATTLRGAATACAGELNGALSDKESPAITHRAAAARVIYASERRVLRSFTPQLNIRPDKGCRIVDPSVAFSFSRRNVPVC
jgi:hypothetical protein